MLGSVYKNKKNWRNLGKYERCWKQHGSKKYIWLSLKRNTWYLWEKKLTKEEIKNYKMTEREIYEKFYNLSEDELNTKNNKNTFVKNNVMTNIIEHCRGEKKRNKSNRQIWKKINDSRAWNFCVSRTWSKIKNRDHIYKQKNTWKKICQDLWNWSLFFYYKEKIQTDENGCKYILFRIDIFFTEYFFAIEINEKGHTGRDLIFEEKRQETLEKKLNCEFIRINASTENYDADHEASRIQVFISKFKDKEK